MGRLMIIQFLRNKTAIASLLLLLAAGVAGIVAGKRFLHTQQAAIEETAAHQKEHIARLVKYENKEMGLLLYYLKFAYINPTSKLASLSIGQRDINSSIQSPTIRNIEAQKYDTNIRNPYQLLSGNFDLGFVILYLFPLVIITLSYNIYSEEKELGTWPLLKVQSNGSSSFLLRKLMVPFIFVTAVLLLLYLLAAILLQLPLDAFFAGFAISNFLYICFWFAVALLVISFFKNSSVNAISLLSAWLVLTILLPAAVNNHITKKYPVPESLSTMLKQRDGYHTRWDMPKDSTMKLFISEYPQYASYRWKEENGFNWLWYYAMQHLGDADAKQDSKLFTQKLLQREESSKMFSRFIPTLHTQLLNNELAQSNLGNHVQFLDSTTRFHEKLRMYFYPRIFTAAPVSAEDWSSHKPVYCSIKNPTRLWESLYTGVFALLLSAIALLRLRQSN
jgi:ABC-2 type transport system permease protein